METKNFAGQTTYSDRIFVDGRRHKLRDPAVRQQERFAAILLIATLPLAMCTSVPQVTSVGKSVTTLEKFSGKAGCDPADVPPPIHRHFGMRCPRQTYAYPFAGWETFRGPTAGCATERVDEYRAVVTFNLTSVSNLKGLVQNAELVVTTRALPPAAGPGVAVTIPGLVALACPTGIGGAGSLVRFGRGSDDPDHVGCRLPADAWSNRPVSDGSGTVYTIPASNTSGAVTPATSPTTIAPSGTGGTTITTDVTGAVTAALNANAAGLAGC